MTFTAEDLPLEHGSREADSDRRKIREDCEGNWETQRVTSRVIPDAKQLDHIRRPMHDTNNASRSFQVTKE